MGEGVFREPGHQIRYRPLRQNSAQYRARDRQKERLGQQLANDAPAAGAYRRANCKLMLAGRTASQQENGDVTAPDGEQQRYGSKQQIERLAQVANIFGRKHADAQLELRRKIVWTFLIKLL